MSPFPPENPKPLPGLTEEQRRSALSLVRRAVEDSVRQEDRPEPPREPSFFSVPAGAFVTILCGEQLRGCIGIVEASRPLGEALLHCAIAAAREDHRFPPVTAEDLPHLRYEISILSPLQEVTSPETVEPGRHGVLIESGERRGLLLPQVAGSRGWDREEFLSQACRKAGLPPHAWRAGVRIWVFEAEVFGEVVP